LLHFPRARSPSTRPARPRATMAYAGGGDPMGDIMKQLNAQVDYVNELLEQIQRLEGQHLAFQKQAAEKQAQLRQALQVADSARAECNDAKRKLAVAQVRRRGRADPVHAGCRSANLLGSTRRLSVSCPRRNAHHACSRLLAHPGPLAPRLCILSNLHHPIPNPSSLPLYPSPRRMSPRR
jgi:hypothetical protein